MVDYLALCYGLSVPMVVAVFIFAMVCGYRKRKSISDTESFITARKSVGYAYIAWSFYAGAVGAWVIASPASYAAYAGILGLVFYSLSSGLPFIMIAFAGEKIRTKVPHVLSLTDYMGWRFGFVAKTLVVVIILFNMSIALLAEYSTIGSIFKSFVGSVPYPMIILIGILTSVYTAYGGLLVSIYTDRVQGVSSLLFFGILAIYMAATFRPDSLPTPMPCSPTDMYCISGTPDCSQFDAYNAQNPDAPVPCPISGYSSIFVMPASLFAATVFSEAMWQRVWASKDKQALHKGAILGAVAVILVVFFSGFCGLLAAWAGLLTYETDPNLYLFQVLAHGQVPAIPTVVNWIGAICVVCASVMNEGAVDSIQNGMAAAITSYITPLYKKWNLNMTRLLVLVLNVVLMIVAIALNGCFSGACGEPGFLKVSVLQLFLIANMLACCVVLPVLAGLFDSLHSTFGGGSFLFSALFPILCVSIYGVNYYNETFPSDFTDFTGKQYTAGNFNDGMFYTWIGNGYAWQFFLVPLGVALGSILLCVGLNLGWRKLNKKQISVRGFRAPATHPDLYSADVVAGLAHPNDSSGEITPGKMPSFKEEEITASKEASPVVETVGVAPETTKTMN